MSAQLSPALQQRAMPIVQKLDGFVAKVEARVQEVLAEADAGLDQLIQQHATDHGPMGAAFTALQSRFHGLGDKVSEAWEKIDGEWDDMVDELDDVSEQDLHALDDTWEAMWQKYDGLRRGLERHHYTVETRKNADWARRLQQIAQQESQQGVGCSQCGTPMALQVPYQVSQQKCPSCGAINDVGPGMAAGLFYQGLGTHALAHEAAWQEWVAEQDNKDAYDKFRNPTAYDQWVWLNAARTYWTKYYQVGSQINPAFAGEGIEKMVEGRLGQYVSFEPPIEGQKRQWFGQLLDASGKGDVAAMAQLLGNRPHHIALDECCECLVEHKHFEGAAIAFGAKYEEDGEDDPRQKWIAEQVHEMRRHLRS